MLLPFLLTQVLGAPSPERIDILIPQPCSVDQQGSGEVVVCANRRGESPYRLKQPALKSERTLPNAQLQIGEGVSVAAETEEADVGGFRSDRAMVRLKVKF